MRLSDLADWFVLRRRLAEPWGFVRLRGRETDGPVEVRLRDGAVVRLRPAPMDRHTFHRIFARDEYRLEGTAPRSLGTVIDVGAHAGFFAARVAPLAERVLCFEPAEGNFGALSANVASWPHVTPMRKAVAGRRGRATLHLSGNPSAHSMHPAAPDRRTAGVEVDCVTLADVFAGNGVDRCGLLKLDCEGAEYEILEAVPRELWPRIGRIAMEYHPVEGGPPGWSGGGLVRLLSEAGHEAELVPSRKDPRKGLLFSSLRR